MGPSGSGKSTLLHCLAGLDRVTSGRVFLGDVEVSACSEKELTLVRRDKIGFVFQAYNLIPTLNAIENIVLPMDFCNTFPPRERRERALSLLEKVGIAEQADKLPADLSGGQQQRAAIARALANDPPLIVADEPTGNLDSHTSDAVMQLFADLAAEGKTVVMVTHERDLTRYFTRSIMLVDGTVSRLGAESSSN